MCRCYGANVYESPPSVSYAELRGFLFGVLEVVENSRDTFERNYELAFKAMAASVTDITQDVETTVQRMTANIKQSKFNTLYVLMETVA